MTAIQELKMKQQSMDAKMDAVLMKLDTSSDGVAQIPDNIELPLENMNDVDCLEEILTDTTTKKTLVRSYHN